MPESASVSALRIAQRDLTRAMERITALNELVAEAADKVEEQDPAYARALRNRAFSMAFVDRRGPSGKTW